MRTVVTISKEWNNPEIKISISAKEISLELSLADFVSALKQEFVPITRILKQKTFENQLDAAIARVLTKAKQETTKVI